MFTNDILQDAEQAHQMGTLNFRCHISSAMWDD